MQQAVGDLNTAALERMAHEMPWFRDLSPEHAEWIGRVVQAGINSFISWYRDPANSDTLTAEVFGTAPRSLAGVITLQQTVAMIRVTIDVVEENIERYVAEADAPRVRAAVLRYGRELAFATADVYAHAAEMRGAWDARLEALVVDSVMRAEADESVRTRASALGWGDLGNVVVVTGHAPAMAADQTRESLVDQVRRSARQAGLDALGATQGDRLVVLLGGVSDPAGAGTAVAGHFGEGPVVVGPMVPDLLHAEVSARGAVAGLRAAPGWPDAPRPVLSDDLLPERALAGDPEARTDLREHVYEPLRAAGPALLGTVSTFLEHGGSVEAAGRALYVHPNTVRYRLRRAAEASGLNAGDPREAYTLRVALTLGRLGVSAAPRSPAL